MLFSNNHCHHHQFHLLSFLVYFPEKSLEIRDYILQSGIFYTTCDVIIFIYIMKLTFN